MKRKEKNHKKYLLAPVIILMYSNKCKCTYVKTKNWETKQYPMYVWKGKKNIMPIY